MSEFHVKIKHLILIGIGFLHCLLSSFCPGVRGSATWEAWKPLLLEGRAQALDNPNGEEACESVLSYRTWIKNQSISTAWELQHSQSVLKLGRAFSGCGEKWEELNKTLFEKCAIRLGGQQGWDDEISFSFCHLGLINGLQRCSALSVSDPGPADCYSLLAISPGLPLEAAPLSVHASLLLEWPLWNTKPTLSFICVTV